MATTVQLPKTFYDDHVARMLPAGVVVKETKRHYLVELDEAEFAELLSDSSHYAWLGTAELGQESLGLVASARATVAALRKVAQ